MVTVNVGNEVLFITKKSLNVEPVGTVTFKLVKLLLPYNWRVLNELLPEKL